MAEKKNDAVKEALSPEDLVTYTAPLDPKSEQQDIIVGVNGELIRIKRGETVKIKRKFLEVLQHAAAQELAAHRTMDKAARSV